MRIYETSVPERLVGIILRIETGPQSHAVLHADKSLWWHMELVLTMPECALESYLTLIRAVLYDFNLRYQYSTVAMDYKNISHYLTDGEIATLEKNLTTISLSVYNVPDYACDCLLERERKQQEKQNYQKRVAESERLREYRRRKKAERIAEMECEFG